MKILHKQIWHLLSLFILLLGINFFIKNNEDVFYGSLWKIDSKLWLYLSIFFAISHQIYVVICWRYELFYKGLSKFFAKNAFKVYKIGFTILILLRPVLIIILSISNSMTINIGNNLSYLICLLLLIPGVYGQYSVFKYFGINKAFGYDHFDPEKFKHTPFVRKGIFKYTPNGMYTFVFLLLWIPGVLFQSKAALLAALFQHIYIWIHYYFTELPDIKFIYGKTPNKMMRNFFKFFAGLIFFLFIGCSSPEQSSDQITKADQFISNTLNENHLPGISVTILKDGNKIYSKGFGYADIDEKRKILPSSTRFRIGSISKTLAASALMKLVEEGKIDLDGSIYFYVPDYPKKRWKFTSRQIAVIFLG